MGEFKIIIHRPGPGGSQEPPVRLGRFSSMVIRAVLIAVAIAVVTVALVFGYLIMGVILALLLVSIVVSMVLGIFQRVRR